MLPYRQKYIGCKHCLQSMKKLDFPENPGFLDYPDYPEIPEILEFPGFILLSIYYSLY